jgi:hypothetical protein
VHELQAQLKLMNDKNETTDELANTGDRQISTIEGLLMEQQWRQSAELVTHAKW